MSEPKTTIDLPFTPAEVRDGTAATNRLRQALQPGDLLTHTRCMGYLEEHVFVKWDGNWMVGKPSNLTWRLTGSRSSVNDIAAGSVTHVNRDPIDVFLAADFQDVVDRSREMVTKAGRL